MKKICLYTCITGNYDQLIDIEREEGFDYYCFTNNKNLISKTWNIIYIQNEGLDNVRLARKIKTIGYAPILNEYDISIWKDSNIVMKQPLKKFVDTMCNLKKYDLIMLKHPDRDCVYDEIDFCIKDQKDNIKNIRNQLEFYQQQNFAKHQGLPASGLFIKKNNNPIVKKTMEDWFNMIEKNSFRDQLSFTYCAIKNNVKIDYLPISCCQNDWFNIVAHTYQGDISTYRLYYGNFNKLYDIHSIQDNYYQKQHDKYNIIEKVLKDTNQIELYISKKGNNAGNILLNKIDINHSVNKILYHNCYKLLETIIFKENGYITIKGKFLKNDLLIIKLKMRRVEEHDYLWILNQANNRLKLYEEKEKKLKNELKIISNSYKKVVGSKGWRIIEKFRKIFIIKKHN